MLLSAPKVIKIEIGVKGDYYDQRRIVNRTTVEYVGDDGHLYRKAFISKDSPVVPESGTHKELNSRKIQY
jgi:hypothetical protein